MGMTTWLIDAGNTRIKWARLSHGIRVAEGVCNSAMDLAAEAAPDRVWISNVAGPVVAAQLEALCRHWRVSPTWVRAEAACCGVRNSYDRPEQLGSDRWVALVAAWHRVRCACLVVSCGTATTVDALSDQGEFLGGLILPGLDLMRSSLAVGTALPAQPTGRLQDFPRNTADAVQTGSVLATVGAIRQHYAKLPTASPCLLGGGAANQLGELLCDLPLIRVESLVLDGLQVLAGSKTT